MRKKQKKRYRERHLPKAGICFEALEPRLLLSGSWGAVVDGPGADTQADSHGSLTQGSMVFHADSGITGAGSEDRSLTPGSSRVDLLSLAPAFNTPSNPVTALEASTASIPTAPVTDDTTAMALSDNKAAATNPDPHADTLDAAIRRELVFVNDNVAAYEILINGIRESDTNRTVEIVVLDADRDGIQQVSDILADRSNLSAVHVIAHGTDGQINLGNSWLNNTTLQQNRDAVADWGNALTATGDILFYGCNIAADGDGQNLLVDIAELTSAEVAASDDLTGSAEKGGDWDLEYQTDAVEASTVLDDGVPWGHTLGVVANQAPWTNLAVTTDRSLTISQNYTVTATPGSDRLLLATMVTRFGNDQSINVTSATFGGVQMHSIVTGSSDTTRNGVWMGYLLDSEILDGAQALTVTFTSPVSDPTGTKLLAATYVGVDQTTPVNDSSANNTDVDAPISFGSQIDYVAGAEVVYVASFGGNSNTNTTEPAGYSKIYTNEWSGLLMTTIGHKDDTATAGNSPDSTAVDFEGTDANHSLAVVALNPVLNAAPVVTTTGGSTAYTEQAAATVIDAGMTLVDADGFDGVDPSDQYTAVIRITGNYEASDTLGFTNTANIQGVLAGDILSLSVIGGQTATVADFQAALQSVTFYNGSDAPGELDRTISFSFDDGVDSSNIATKVVTVAAVNDDPVVTLPGAPVTYYSGGSAVVVDTSATVSDVDSTNFFSGDLRVGFMSGGTANDVLAIRNQGTGAGEIAVSGSTVSYEGATIGTFSGGTGGALLDINLNTSATPEAVQALARNITYENISATPATGLRQVRFALRDGDGGQNGIIAQTVDVVINSAPTADIGGPYNINEGDDLTLDASGSSDPELDALTYRWDLDNNGVYDDAVGVNPTIDWADLKAYGFDNDRVNTIGLEVDDGNGNTDTATIDVTVSNVAPTLTVTGNATVTAGNNYTLNLSSSDPGNDTITGWTINWGDGTIEDVVGNPSSVSHTYAMNVAGHTFNISASANDSDGTYFNADLIATSWASSLLYRFDGDSGAFESQFGSGDGLNAPDAITLGPDGLLYVANFNGNNILRYNPNTLTLVDTFITTGLGGLDGPTDVLFLADGSLLVSSNDSGEILRYNDAGGSLGAFVTAGSGGLIGPNDLLIGIDGMLYVSDYEGHQILRFNASDGTFVDQLANSGNGLNNPEQMDFGPDGRLYVANGGGGNVLAIDTTTKVVSVVVTSASAPSTPTGLQVGPDGNLYVAGYGSSDVRVYDGSSGASLGIRVSSGSGGLSGPYHMTFLADQQVTILNTAPELIGAGLHLTSISEDPTVNNGDLVSAILASTGGDPITDVDAGAVEGIAIFNLSNSNGTWEYDTGSGWTAVGSVSVANSLLLRDTDRLRFVPNANWNGTELFSFAAWDQTSGTAGTKVDTSVFGGTTAFSTGTAVPSITVNGVNDAPTAADNTITTPEEQIYTFTVSDFGYNDVEGDPLALVKILPIHAGNFIQLDGTVLVTSVVHDIAVADITAGKLTFHPPTDLFGSADLFYFGVNDGTSDSAAYTMSVTVTPVSDAPTLNNGTLASINEDTANPAGETVAAIFSGQFSDSDGDGFGGIAVVDNTADAVTQGTWQYSTNGGTNWFAIGTVADDSSALALSSSSLVRFLPVADYNGTPPALTVRGMDDTYAGGYSITAGSETRINVDTSSNGGTTAIAAATAGLSTSVNPVVDVVNDTLTTNEETAGTIDVLANDSFEGTPVVTSVTQGANGTVVNNGDGTVTYTPGEDFNGSDSYTYTVTSGGVTETATVNVTVNAVADVADDTLTTNEDTAGTINVLANDSFEGTPVVTSVTQGTNGTVVNNGDGTVTYTPGEDFNGSDSYTYTVTSGGVTETATVNVTVNAVADVADDTLTTNEDTAGTINVLANDSFEGTPVVTSITQGTNGTVVNNGDGTVTYTPGEDFNGTDSYTYTVTSGGVTETATVNVTVNAVIDVTDDTLTTNEDTAGTLNVLTNDTFGAGATVTGVTDGANGSVAFLTDGTVTYTPNTDFNGSDSFTYTVTTAAGDTETATVNVTVNAVVDVTDDTLTTNEDTAGTLNVLTNDTFGAGATVTGVTQGTNGSVAFLADGTVTYTPNTDFNGSDTFTYTVTTAAGDTETATVNVTVNAVADVADDTLTTNEDTAGIDQCPHQRYFRCGRHSHRRDSG